MSENPYANPNFYETVEDLARRYLQPSASGDGYQVFPVSLVRVPATVTWTLNPKNVFRSEDEKITIQQTYDQETVRASAFWLHPVRYEPAVDESNTRRTVQIDKLPLECTEKDILSTLYYGKIESITLARIGNFQTKHARVVFTRERSAYTMARYGNERGIKVLGDQARVYQQEEPTYPHCAEVDTAVHELGMTRIISTRAQIGGTGQTRLVGILEEKTEGGRTLMEFRSIRQAYRAMLMLQEAGIEVQNEADYCNRLATNSYLTLELF